MFIMGTSRARETPIWRGLDRKGKELRLLGLLRTRDARNASCCMPLRPGRASTAKP
jgi:hypothetical protein